jgi:hypothetical protein
VTGLPKDPPCYHEGPQCCGEDRPPTHDSSHAHPAILWD